MPVDMREDRFREELGKLPKFEPKGLYDQRVWKKEAKFPAWRALFTSLCLFCHSTGYRLPSFDYFFSLLKNALTLRHPESARFEQFFKGELLPGMLQRASVWYESGMAETYLYACLVEAIEDKAKCGIVIYDPRIDWKNKGDLTVIVKQLPFRISAFSGEKSDRPNVEARREKIERDQKQNTMESAHWGNAELEVMPQLTISLIGKDVQVVNGLRLFSLPAVNRLLEEIYQQAGVKERRFLFPSRTTSHRLSPSA